MEVFSLAKVEIVLLFAVVGVVAEHNEVRCCDDDHIFDESAGVCLSQFENRTAAINLKCQDEVIILPESIFNSYLNQSGQLTSQDDDAMEHGKFCVANNTLNSSERYLAICTEEEEKNVSDEVFGYCLIVSVVFLAMTVAVYCLLPEIRDLQGKSVISFCTSLALGLGILSILKLMEYSDMALCAVRGFLLYFFIVASFFWTNAISIQILLNIRRPLVSDYGWKAYIFYALYSWGCPAVLTIMMAIVNFHPGSHKKPGIGLNHCWFYDKTQQWYYMYSVTTLLILVNICIFVYISMLLWRQSFSSTHVKALRYKFLMTVRMFVVMGIPWVFEMISSLSPPHIIWDITDLFNILQGPLIFFLLVVFRRRVVKALYKKGYLDCMSGLVEKHLAIADDEENVVEHTTEVPLH